jgi:hypothetical protein
MKYYIKVDSERFVLWVNLSCHSDWFDFNRITFLQRNGMWSDFVHFSDNNWLLLHTMIDIG